MKQLFSDVTVNGETISVADIAAEAQNHAAPKGKPGIAWRKAARALAIRSLLLAKSKSAGITAKPREIESDKFETADEANIRAVMEEYILPDTPTQSALQTTYERHKDRFRAPSLFEPAHILISAAPDDEEKRQAARAKADAILDILKKDAKAFDRLARSESACPSRDIGGQLGQLVSGDTVPEFEAALDDMKVGELKNTPVESRYGFHIVRLDAKEEGRILPFDSVREQISQALEKTAWAVAAQRFTQDLLESAQLTGIDLGTGSLDAA